MGVTVEALAELVRGRVIGDGRVPIHAARPVSDAGPGDITFVDDERYAKQLRVSPPSAVIVGPHFAGRNGLQDDLPLIEVADPLGAFLAIREHLARPEAARWTGIHPLAWVAPTAKLGQDVAIHPFACVGEGTEIGDGATLRSHAVVGRNCRIGARVVLHPCVVIYDDVIIGDGSVIHAGTVVGADGFGYRQINGRHAKIPQTGWVEIGADVEIGANGAIDRGTFGATVVGEGTKIDNLVMIGHNNQIGRHNLLCGQVGLAGSCTTGDYVMMGGQVGVKDHTAIGDRVMIGAEAGVHRDIPAGQQVLGSPATPIKEQRQLFALIARLPVLFRQVKQLCADVVELRARLSTSGDLDRRVEADRLGEARP